MTGGVGGGGFCGAGGELVGACCGVEVTLVVCTVGAAPALPCAVVVVVEEVAAGVADGVADVADGLFVIAGGAVGGGRGSGVGSGAGAATPLFAGDACAVFGSFLRTAVLMMRTTPTTPAASDTPRNAALM